MRYEYAVIAPGQDSTELGEVTSQHFSKAAAEKALLALPDAPGYRLAYIARRRGDGEWEHQAEALKRVGRAYL